MKYCFSIELENALTAVLRMDCLLTRLLPFCRSDLAKLNLDLAIYYCYCYCYSSSFILN
jgi:hypothetical protein